MKKKFYCTFGYNQKYFGRFVVIEADDEQQVHEIMHQHVGSQWAFCYSESEWIIDGVSQEKMFNLHEINLRSL